MIRSKVWCLLRRWFGFFAFALASAFGPSWRGRFGLFFRRHPPYAFVLQASPLCGAAPTFLCRRKEK
jgi:hypothetical protein